MGGGGKKAKKNHWIFGKLTTLVAFVLLAAKVTPSAHVTVCHIDACISNGAPYSPLLGAIAPPPRPDLQSTTSLTKVHNIFNILLLINLFLANIQRF